MLLLPMMLMLLLLLPMRLLLGDGWGLDAAEKDPEGARKSPLHQAEADDAL